MWFSKGKRFGCVCAQHKIFRNQTRDVISMKGCLCKPYLCMLTVYNNLMNADIIIRQPYLYIWNLSSVDVAYLFCFIIIVSLGNGWSMITSTLSFFFSSSLLFRWKHTNMNVSYGIICWPNFCLIFPVRLNMAQDFV